MKKSFNLIFLLAAMSTLVSCNNSLSTNSTSKESSTSQPSDENMSYWSDDVKALLEKYCGEVLPYPQEGLTGNITAIEVSNYEESYLQISDESSSFLLKSIHYEYDLESAGWTIQKDYNGNTYKSLSSNSTYVELTKVVTTDEKSSGYRILFSYDSESNCNIINCYKNLNGSLSSNTAYSKAEDEAIKESLITSLPFGSWGSDYVVLSNKYLSFYVDENTIQVQDSCALNVISSTVEALKNDGFVLDKLSSAANGIYVLNKALIDEDNNKYAIINVLATYDGGNVLLATYNPLEKSSNQWPSEFIGELETITGISVPTFTANDITTYNYYKKHDTYYISATTSTSLYDTYMEKLEQNSFYSVANDPSLYSDWKENIQISLSQSYNSSTYEPEGFSIAVKALTSEKTFVDSYPADKVQQFLDSQSISRVAPFSLDETGSEMYRYTLTTDYEARYNYWFDYLTTLYRMINSSYTEEEIKGFADEAAKDDLGINIEFLDVDQSLAKKLKDKFYNAGWHMEEYFLVGYKFEDPDGKMSVIIYFYDNGITQVEIGVGSGETHNPVFEFSLDSVFARPGDTIDLSRYLTVDMLPYTITYTSLNENILTVDSEGEVSVSSSATNNSSAQVKASVTTSTGETIDATFTIKITTLTKADITTKLSSLLKNKVIAETFKEEDDNGLYYIYGAFLQEEVSIEEAKQLLESEFILENFELSEDTPEWIEDVDGNNEPYEYLVYAQPELNYIQYSVYTDVYEGVTYTWIQMVIISY